MMFSSVNPFNRSYVILYINIYIYVCVCVCLIIFDTFDVDDVLKA